MLTDRSENNRVLVQADGNGVSHVDHVLVQAEASRLRAEELLRQIRGAANLVRKVVSRVAIWYKRQRLFEELDGMSDYVLADMGMDRENLRATVNRSYPYPSLAAAANDDLDSRKAAA